MSDPSEEELRALVEQWRAKQEWHREQSTKHGKGGSAWQTFKECADDLEELLTDQQRGDDDE